MALNATQLTNLKPKATDYRVLDEDGLYVLVRKNGVRLLRFDYTLHGTRRTLSIGEYGEEREGKVTLARARRIHADAIEAIAKGEHPVSPAQARRLAEEGAKAKAAAEEAAKADAEQRTFGRLADEWLAARKVGNSPKTYARDVRSVGYLKDGYRTGKGFGHVAVEQVETSHLSNLCEKFNKPTRIRMISAARKIMGVAKRKGWIKHSPFADVDFHEGLAKHREKKRPAITDEAKFAALLRDIEGYDGRGHNLTRYGLRLLALTFVRPATMAKAEWSCFDLHKAQWVIPFASLKMEWLRSETGEAVEDFVVPLSRQAVALLHELHEITGKGRYLFPALGVGRNPGEVMSENTLNFALHSLGYKGVHCAHGFRSSASTILNRQRNGDGRRMFDRSLVELQLDHQDGSTRAVYDRDDALPERVELMQYWADLLDTLQGGGRSKAKQLKAA
ncbi:integrase arm-type DNA-binding domain-containing protein [Bradyrhizobium sp. I1.7.5]|uniref:tyrosine-type recombinase/integrase n=1 Tax=Bradyrhizobium sp. I1.7.5 TaxID=3156363 RepID=UPI003395340C